jgi:predicted regulator of Ras-like GTPase activity (Roadblock/LC7/MglB family)
MEVESMNDEVCAFALKNTLNEIHSICPDIKSAFIFKEDGEVIAGDVNTPEKTIVRVLDSLDGILDRAESVNGVEGIILEGNKGKVIVSCMNALYLVTVTSEKADMKYVDTVTRVLIPTVLKLAEEFNPTSLKDNSPPSRIESDLKPEFPTCKSSEPEEEPTEAPLVERPGQPFEPEIKPEASLPDPPVNQLIAENLGGLLVPSDTVRVDNDTLSQWSELYEGRKIEEVEVETFDGKTARCKVRPIKESKYEGKGIVQMPEKVQLVLEIKKGELVRVKPVIE